MQVHSRVLVKGSCYLYNKNSVPGFLKTGINVRVFFEKHPICEICNKNNSSMALINNRVFVAICHSCADGINVVDIKKEPEKIEVTA